jgi:UDP-N-acetylmuramoyl-tripeptide--D-alanyl-D-alanine ligase
MILKNLIYILQSENYDFKRFLRFAYSRFDWWRLEKRKKIVWTAKARLINIISVIIFSFFAAYSLVKYGWLGGVLIILLMVLFLPFLVGLSLIIIKPLDIILKIKRIKKAKNLLKSKKPVVIGIAGSYGKTSAKEILNSVLSGKFKVLKTPENVNTDIGIANFIIKEKEKLGESDIFIAEMGAYRVGDIAKICEMVKPDYSILTGINESHLERFGSLENIIKGKFELPERTKKISFVNFDDENIKSNLEKFKIGNCVKISAEAASDIAIKENFGGLEFSYKSEKFFTKLLAKHNIVLIILAAELAGKLGMSLEEIKNGVEKIKPLTNRLNPIYNNQSNIWVIDDSYNANLNGILSGLEVLERAQGRKVVLTPGLVELGDRSEEIHKKIGKAYAEKANLVLLIKNSVAPYIIEGMEENNFHEFKVYNNTGEAHNDLKNILKSGDTIIFQNDWPDNYL